MGPIFLSIYKEIRITCEIKHSYQNKTLKTIKHTEEASSPKLIDHIINGVNCASTHTNPPPYKPRIPFFFFLHASHIFINFFTLHSTEISKTHNTRHHQDLTSSRRSSRFKSYDRFVLDLNQSLSLMLSLFFFALWATNCSNYL